MKLYHSTYVANLASIKKLGLGGKQVKNWEISRDGVVCFSSDPEVAYSFCESAEDVSDTKYDSGIVVLSVDSRYLNKSLVSLDKNNKDNTTIEYRGIIDPRLLKLVNSEGREVDFYTSKRYMRYE